MSWRLWYCRQHQHDRIDNNIITSLLLLSPAFMVHDAYSHEVPQLAQNHSEPTTTHQQQQQQQQQPILEPINHHSRSFIQQNTPSLTHTDQIDLNDEEYDDEDEDDYYLSDEEEEDLYEEDEQDDLDDTNYHFIKDFTKTQPRPATPRRSLLSDLLQRVSSPPSLLSNSSSSFTSHSTTQHSILLDEEQQEEEEEEEDFNSTRKYHTTTLLTTNNESFHGW